MRVDLKPLSVDDYARILTQPEENALVKQYQLLLGVDNVTINFKESAVGEIARFAWQANETSENIGARRLHTIMEAILSDIAFNAGGGDAPEVIVDVETSTCGASWRTRSAPRTSKNTSCENGMIPNKRGQNTA